MTASQTITLGALGVRFVLEAEASGGGATAFECSVPAGAVMPAPHSHDDFDETNYGMPQQEALVRLAERVPVADLGYFVVAVLIQRDTGGNLAEILDNLGHVVRERFKILRQVRVHTAHGRFTAVVLLSLPAALGVALTFLNPEHMHLLFTDKMGQMMILIAIVMQTIGFVWIRQVIKIEV